jgi:hypothetical protein
MIAAGMVAITTGSAEAHKLDLNKFLQRALTPPQALRPLLPLVLPQLQALQPQPPQMALPQGPQLLPSQPQAQAPQPPQQPRTAGRVDNDARIAFSREQGRKLREETEQAEAKRTTQ